MRLIVPIDEMLQIVKTQFANPAVILSNLSKKKFCESLSWSWPLIDHIATNELINSSLNTQLLYYKVINMIKL